VKNRITTTSKLWLQEAVAFIWGNKPVRYPVLLFGLAAAAFLLLFLADRVVMPVMVHWGEATTVPDLTNLSLTEAEELAHEEGLNLEVLAEVHDPARPPGTILSQIPSPNTKVREGRLVRITVSMGGKTVLVPRLEGVSVRQAELLLMHEGLEMGEITWSASDSFPEDVVITSIPSHDTPVPAGMPINLRASLGMRPDTVMVPDLVGTTLEEGKKMLREIGLELGRVKLKVNNDFLPNTILRQSLGPGEKVETGSRIVLEVSTTE
jgi:beta-lactam-binding protein with PASTA domain